MKTKLLIVLSALAFLASALVSPAADVNGAAKTREELKALVTTIQSKVKEGKRTPAELSDELKQFDTLLAEHQGEKTDEVAQILLMKATLYVEVFDDTDKGAELIKQLKREYPETGPGKAADGVLQRIEQVAQAKKIQKSLVAGAKFPDFTETDVTGKPVSVANYKGKVVLVDFWATWCGPCVQELPNVIRAYEKHHAQGFDIIGVSLDQDEKKLKDFTAQMKMPWQQYYDGKGWSNKLAVRYGIQSIPATFLLDAKGNIIAKNVRGDALEVALSKALVKN